MTTSPNEQRWVEQIADQVQGKTIAEVRYMTQDEAEGMGWFSRPVVLIFDDGTAIWPSSDDEGNDGGAMFSSSEKVPTFPVMRS